MRINPPPREVKQKRPRKLRPGQIYLIRSDNGFYKIGRSANAVARFKNLTVQLPYKLELLLVIETDDTVRLEKELHERFHHCRSRGEWFALSDEDVEWIKSYSATSELG
jgi:hypothetical protein